MVTGNFRWPIKIIPIQKMQSTSPIDGSSLSKDTQTIKRPTPSETPTVSKRSKKLASIGFQTPLPSIAPMEISPYTPEDQIRRDNRRLRNYGVRRVLYLPY